jgi:hypothetical protein
MQRGCKRKCKGDVKGNGTVKWNVNVVWNVNENGM